MKIIKEETSLWDLWINFEEKIAKLLAKKKKTTKNGKFELMKGTKLN